VVIDLHPDMDSNHFRFDTEDMDTAVILSPSPTW